MNPRVLLSQKGVLLPSAVVLPTEHQGPFDRAACLGRYVGILAALYRWSVTGQCRPGNSEDFGVLPVEYRMSHAASPERR
jgi:hypothetical protein